jgi:SAM-dependent methyltransferase
VVRVTDELTQIENDSIRKFVHSAADEGYLRGRVLDYGCGRSPYRRIVEEHGGEYVGFDRKDVPTSEWNEEIGLDFVVDHEFDTILCTQVIQYVRDLLRLFRAFRHSLESRDGHLVLTYPTNWPEVEESDIRRLTRSGMAAILTEAGFSILRHERRATFHQHGYEWAFGYGCVARA